MKSRQVIAFGLTAGLFAGLAEGLVHFGLHRLGILDNSWYPILWIAAIVTGLIVGAFSVAVAALLQVLPDRPAIRSVALFAVLLAALFPVLTLSLKEWVARYAIVLFALGFVSMVTRALSRGGRDPFRTGARLLPAAVTLTVLAVAGIEGGAWLTERIGTSRLPAAKPGSPNVLVIVMDALRADRLGAYGYSRPTSPVIDRLAAEGVVFDNAFSTTSYTLPSHASMLTGRYPRDHKVDGDTSHQDPTRNMAVLPAELQQQGYRTAAFSGNTFYFSREHGFGHGFLHFEDFFHSWSDMFLRTAYGGLVRAFLLPRFGNNDLPGRKRASETNEAIDRWIRRDTEKPFFVMVNYMDVHDPYLPLDPFAARFSTTGQPPPGHLNFQKHVSYDIAPELARRESDAYDAAIAYTDDQFGKLLEIIRAQSSKRDLLVIVTADHAEEFGEHKGFLHGGHLYREVLHVPLVVWQPGQVPGGARISTPVSNASIAATVLTLVSGTSTQFKVPSLVELWKNPESADNWPLPIAELAHRPWSHRERIRFGAMRAVFDARFHLMEQDGRPDELYDWIADPAEQVNLADRPEHSATLERLRAALK